MSLYMYVPDKMTSWKEPVMFQSKDKALKYALRKVLLNLNTQYDINVSSCHIEEYTANDMMDHTASYVVSPAKIVEVIDTYMAMNDVKLGDVFKYFDMNVHELVESCIIKKEKEKEEE